MTKNFQRNMRRIIFSLLIGFSSCFLSCSTATKPMANNGPLQSLKVMSYNVHHCNPPSKPGFIDIDAVANVIKRASPDLVALQEIDMNVARSGSVNQAIEITRKAGYHSFYFAKALDYDGGQYGVMILSKYPLSDGVTYRLPTEQSTKGEPRVLALITVNLPGGKKIKFGSTHLDAQQLPVNRLLQVKEITRITGAESLPIVLAGDFNAEETSEVINILDDQFVRTCKNCSPTIPETNPVKAIDFIAFKKGSGFSSISHRVVQETYASDHLPVVAELTIN